MRVRVNQPPHHKTRLSIPASKWAVAHFAELKRGLGSACKNLIRKYTRRLILTLFGPPRYARRLQQLRHTTNSDILYN
jgi:hypothetical protein